MKTLDMDILLFGVTKDIIGKQKLSLKDGLPETVGGLRKWLAVNYPDVGKLSSLAIAVDNEYADDDTALNINAEIALLPPVSGG